jgi:hypothetical protein
MSVKASLSSRFQTSGSTVTSQPKSAKNHRHLHIAFHPTFWHLPGGFQWLHPMFLYSGRVRAREKQNRIVSATLRGG